MKTGGGYLVTNIKNIIWFFLKWESLWDSSFYVHLLPLFFSIIHMLILDNITWRCYHNLKSSVRVKIPKKFCCFIYHPIFGLLFHFSPKICWQLDLNLQPPGLKHEKSDHRTTVSCINLIICSSKMSKIWFWGVLRPVHKFS